MILRLGTDELFVVRMKVRGKQVVAMFDGR